MRRVQQLFAMAMVSVMVVAMGAAALAVVGDEETPAEEVIEAVDTDGDGLSDDDEEGLDGDGLTNAEELNVVGNDPLLGENAIVAGECTVTFIEGSLEITFEGETLTLPPFDPNEMENGKKLNHGRVVSTVAKAAPKACHGEIVSAVAQSEWGKMSDDDVEGPDPDGIDETSTDDNGEPETANRGNSKDKAKGPKNKG